MRAFTLPFWLVQAGTLFLFSAVAIAEVELPRSVPSAKLTQQVGLTEIAVEYECPAVKGRKIWGGVVPLGEVWAAGPGAATRIKFSKDVTIGDKAVPAGSYWLLAMPTKTTWTFVINKSPDAIASARDYKSELDVARIQVSPKPTQRHERLMFSFSELTDDRASLDLEWETVRLPIPIQVNTTQQVLASINGLDSTWRSFANAARYMLEKKKDYDAGLKYIDQALALKDDWYSMWVKGALLAAKGDFAAARDWGVKAHDLAEQVGNGHALEADLNKSIAEWTRKGGLPSRDSQPLTKVGGDAPKKAAADVGGSLVTPPAFKAASGRDPGPIAPIDDPPILRRARLRRR
jgi:hypothetical protein